MKPEQLARNKSPMLRIPRGLSGGFRAQLGRFPAIQRLFYSVGSTAGPNGAFEVVAKQTIPELAVDGTLFVHKATRATLLSLKSHQDDNKVFGAAFRTPPTDSSGVAHIIEHSVLCGSRKYPLKEPFAELIKSSLQNFLNAMTYPDRTVYPVASQNLADFYHLVDVYLDAVFHPCLRPHTLLQEGWHHEIERTTDGTPAGLTYKGVVFNEMKGVYSSPDSLHHMALQAAMFPDTCYNHSSGGDPAAIPDLTYKGFKTFHEEHYHPSNSLLYFYGDDDEGKRLEIAGDYLSGFAEKALDFKPRHQLQLKSPRFVAVPYPCAAAASVAEDQGDSSDALEDEDDAEEDADGDADGASENKHFSTLGWVLNFDETGLDDVSKLAMLTLGYMLLGTPSAPLKKALMASGLGEAVTGYGYEDDLLQATFTVGLKGIKNAADTAQVEPLIFKTLEALVANGFEADHIAAAVNTIEFQLREFATDSDSPRGLSMFLSAVPNWVYGRNMLEQLAYEDVLVQFKKRVEEDPRLFQSLIQRLLLSNPHRVSLHMYPDPSMAARVDAEEKERLAVSWEKIQASGGITALQEENDQLLAWQKTVDSPEALACIPSLQLSDLAASPKTIPRVVETASLPVSGGTVPVLLHDQPCNGIGYVRILFELKDRVPAHLLPLLPLYARCLTQLGTQHTSEVNLSHRMGKYTGGIHAFNEVLDYVAQPSNLVSKLTVTGKATKDKIPALFELLEEILTVPNFDAKDTVTSFVREAIAGMEGALISSGLSFAMLHLGSGFTKSKWLSEQFDGYTQLQYSRQLLNRIETDWPSVVEDLKTVHRAVVASNGSLASFTGDTATLSILTSAFQPFVDSLAEKSTVPMTPWEWSPVSDSDTSVPIAFTVPTQVNYVAKAGVGYPLGPTGSADVISSYLRMSYLWERVRVQGGAYGAGCSVNRFSGVMAFHSYRDPNLTSTLDVFDGTSKFLAEHPVSSDDIRKAILSTIGSMDSPLSPDTKGVVSTNRYLVGITEADVQARRDQVLSTSLSDFSEFGAASDRVARSGRVAVITSKEAAAESGLPFFTIDPFSSNK